LLPLGWCLLEGALINAECRFKLYSPESEEEFARYFQFRWQQLRQPLNLPVGSEQDALESHAYHCMAVTEDHTIIAVGRIHFDSELAAQVRFMAVHPSYQRRQVGKQVLDDLLNYAKNASAKTCWLNARASAIHFYEAQGFVVLDEVNTQLDIPHYRMEKTLN